MTSYQQLPHPIRELAEDVLTEKQLQAWQLELNGLGIRPIAYRQGVTPRVIVDRLRRTHQLLTKAGIRQDHHGRWHLQSEEAA